MIFGEITEYLFHVVYGEKGRKTTEDRAHTTDDMTWYITDTPLELLRFYDPTFLSVTRGPT